MTSLADLENAVATIAHTLAANEVKHRGEWRTRPAEHHVRHAVLHLDAWLENHDPTDLGNALTRVAFAAELVCRAARVHRINDQDTTKEIAGRRPRPACGDAVGVNSWAPAASSRSATPTDRGDKT